MKTPIYFATPFRNKQNPHLIGFNEIDQKTRMFEPIRGTIAELPVDQSRNILVEDFLIKTKDHDDAWLFFIDDDILLPTDTLDLFLNQLNKTPGKVFFGDYCLKKRSYESANIINNNIPELVATGILFVHKSVFIELRMKKITAFDMKYDGRWFVCSSEKENTGEDTYFTKTLQNLNITPIQIEGLEGIHIDFAKKAAFASQNLVSNGKIRKEIAYIYAINPEISPIYNDLVEQCT